MAAKKSQTNKKTPGKKKAPGGKAAPGGKKAPAENARTGARAKKSAARKSAARKPAAKKSAASQAPAPDTPSFFRLTVEVGNLDQAAEFYNKLFDTKGLRSPGERVYIQAGPVALQVLDVSASSAPHPAAKSLYFTVKDLDAVHYRATMLGALSEELVHGSPGGQIARRPWGERSFYAEDPWGNPLCFVEAGTPFG
jgi:predicted enzyme related to lactoylglutathione lyase